MVVKIRLARFGKRHAPFYNIVVAQERTARNSKPLEVLGTYDPIPKPPSDGPENAGRKFKDIKLDFARAKYWLGVGAQPSDPAWRLLAMVSASMSAMRSRCEIQQRSSKKSRPCDKPTDTAFQIGLIEPKHRPGLQQRDTGSSPATSGQTTQSAQGARSPG